MPSAHVLPISFPRLFYFIRFIARSDILLCGFVVLSGSRAPVTSMTSIYVYSMYMADIALLMCLFIPLLAVIFVNVVSTAILCISCMNYFLFIQCWWIGCNTSFRQTSSQVVQQLSLDFLFWLLWWCSRYPWFLYCLLLLCLHICLLVHLGHLCRFGIFSSSSCSMSSLLSSMASSLIVETYR